MSTTTTRKRRSQNGHLDADTVKRAASGRWPEIFSALAGVDRSILDGKHHPCPRCEGNDRFRLIDEDAGALFCNKCFDTNNGDGLAALQWLLGIDFPTALDRVATHLGIKPASNSRSRKLKPEEQVKWPDDARRPMYGELITGWCQTKPPITPEAVAAFGGRYCWWPKSAESPWRCVAFAGRNLRGEVIALILYRVDGQDFPEVGKLDRRKTHTVRGSKESWLYMGTPNDLKQAETIVKVEGGPDALALWSTGLPDGWAVITNTCGAKSASPRKLDFGCAADKKVIVVGDADEPGQEGARRHAAAFHRAGAAKVRMIELPYDVADDHGKDLRDWLVEGHTFDDFRTMAEAAKPVTDKQVAEWRKKPIKKGLGDRIANATIIVVDEVEKIIPMPMNEVIANILEKTGNWPRRVDRSLFVDDGTGSIRWLDRPPSLFGWLARKCGVIDWRRATGCVTKEEVFAEFQGTAQQYAAIEEMPHEPRIDDHYYACKFPRPGCGSTVKKLLDFFAPESDLDRQLFLAVLATPLWGGPPGTRPAGMFTATKGRGRGKSKAAQFTARVWGGYVDVSPSEEIAIIKQRLLTADATPLRMALLDNVKSTRFSWGEMEALITSDTISGKRLYVGDARRPNYLTWLITLNGASLSTDMAQRTVEIRLADPEYRSGWEEDVKSFVETNHPAIIGDLIGFLRRPPKPLRRHTRWGSWESGVLARVESPNECLDAILERRGQADVEEEEGAVIEDFFASKLRWLEYDIDRDDIFMPNEIVAQWYVMATGDRKKVTGVTRTLKQMKDEGRQSRLVPTRAGPKGERGFRWVGEHAGVTDATHYDIRKRLAEKRQAREASEDTEAENGGF
ncbi:primase-helicase zinc-binding domain-containing protein [Planctomycetota bacterium]